MAKSMRTSKIPFYTGSARFSPGDSSNCKLLFANSLGETVHFLRSAHHGYGIAIAHFSLGDSQNSQLQWTNSLGETLHFSCRKVISHLVCWTGCNPKPCTWSILTSRTSWSFSGTNCALIWTISRGRPRVLTPRHTETRQCLLQWN